MNHLSLSLAFLGIGLAVGFLAQRSRMCFVAGLRDWILVRDTELLLGLFSFLVTVWLLSSAFSALGLLRHGIPEYGQASPASPSPASLDLGNVRSARVFSAGVVQGLLNRFFFATIAGGFLIGCFSVLAGGCVMRQHVLCAQGNGNALFYLVGFYGAVVVYYTLLARFFAWFYG